MIRERDLVYSASYRCPCGAGIAYEKNVGPNGCWDCSAILLGTADPRMVHTDRLPFIFYEIKSEGQPSAHGATTRPSAPPGKPWWRPWLP